MLFTLFILVNLLKHKFIPGCVAVDFSNLISITWKVQRRTATIWPKKVRPKFSLVKGQFKMERDKSKCEQEVMLVFDKSIQHAITVHK